MDAEQVVEKILSDARAEADAIKAEAEAKASELEAKQRDELQAFRSETERLAQDAGASRKSRMLANARMAIRKDYLVAKHGLIEQVFARASEQIGQLGDDEYQELIIDLMAKSVESGDEEVVVGAGETRINERVIKEVNRKLGTGFKGNLHLASDKANIDKGFILRRGKVQINVSIDVLVSQAREALETEITSALFGE